MIQFQAVLHRTSQQLASAPVACDYSGILQPRNIDTVPSFCTKSSTTNDHLHLTTLPQILRKLLSSSKVSSRTQTTRFSWERTRPRDPDRGTTDFRFEHSAVVRTTTHTHTHTRTHTHLRQCDNYNLKSYRRCKNMSRMNLSEYIGHVTEYSLLFTIACCLLVRLWLGLDSVCDWWVVMHTYLCAFML